MLIRPDQNQLPTCQGQRTEPADLPWWLQGACAYVNQQEGWHWKLTVQGQAAPSRKWARCLSHWVLGTRKDMWLVIGKPQYLRTSPPSLPPSFPPCLLTNLHHAHLSELLCRGEDWLAHALPCTVGAAELIV